MKHLLTITFVSVLQLSLGVYLQETDVECKSLLDFCFVIDGSDSISKKDFQLLRDSISRIVDQLNIGKGEGRMGIIVYSRDIAMNIPLSYDRNFLKEKAMIMPHPRDGTNTAFGIKRMIDMFNKHPRPNVPKVGIVLTDGISKDPNETSRQSQLARESGINMFSVGVTRNIDYDELNAIASDKKQVLMVDSFDELAKNIGGLVKLVCPADCGSPIEYPNTVVNPGSTIERTKRVYECIHNTVMEGNPEVVCMENGQWSLTDLYCRPNCGEPHIVPRTTVTPGHTLEGDIRTYQCDKGTVLEGEPAIFCENNGQWSKPLFYCRPDCGQPRNVPRASYSVGSTLEGNITSYTCDPNTVLEGDPSIICGENGKWSSTNFYCRPDCKAPPTISRASYHNGPTVEGSTITYHCDPNTDTEGNPTIVCGSDGKWSVTDLYCRPDCGTPSTIPNAEWTPGSTLEGSKAIYRCLGSTVLEGDPSIVCQNNGQWSATTFYCRPDCSIPNTIPNAEWNPGPTLEGSKTTFHCLGSTVLEGDPSIVCLNNGKWSSSSFYCRPDCGVPLEIPRSSFELGPTVEGSAITYHCDRHTVREGNPTITCESNGKWTKSDMYCRPDCGVPNEIPNAIWEPGSTLEGSSTIYSCVQHTVLEGDSTITCGGNGKWSKPSFYCRPDCGIPHDYPNAAWKPGPSLEGDTTTYFCASHTVLEGYPTVVCGAHGKWSSPEFYCRPDCGIPMDVPNSVWKPGSSLEGNKTIYECIANTVLEGDPSVICKKDGKWSQPQFYCRPDCGIPMEVPRATRAVGSTLEGSTLTYMCNINTMLEGNSSITCGVDGKWSHPNFYCRPDCREPPNLPGTTVSAGGTLEGSIRHYSCRPGTVAEGTTESKCGNSGQWSEPNMYCRPDCGKPKDVENALIKDGPTLEGAVREYYCINNMVVEGNSEITCGKDGHWSPTSFQCKNVCDEPRDVLNAYVLPGELSEGSVRRYECKPGTVMQGSPEIVCRPNGKWTITTMECRPDCGPPPHIPHTTYSHGPTTEGSIVTYKCDANTAMEGNPKIMCKRNGKWSMTNLHCRPDCGEPPSIPYAVLLPGPTTRGTSRYYECRSGCETIGNPEIRCMDDGKWSKTEFYCHVTSTPIPMMPSTLSPISGPCDFCKMQYGVGFNPHPEDCDKFTQCYFDKNGHAQAVYRQCPFGQYWDQELLTCRPSEQVNCKQEKCVLRGLLSYPYGNTTSCRAYWKCNLGKSIGMCCPYGYSYQPYRGCTEDAKCKDSCPPQIYHEGACDTRPSWNNVNGYQQRIPGLGWKEMSCATGTRYDCNTCKCEYHESFLPGKVCKPEVHIPFDDDCDDLSEHHYKIDVHNVTITQGGLAYFNGLDSRLVIPHIDRMNHYTDLVVRIRYLDVPDVGLRGLISNGDYQMPGMMIVKSKRNLHYMARCDSDRITTFHLPMNPGNWNELLFMHDAKKLEGKVNGIGAEKWAFGYIQKSGSGLQVGHAKGFQNFHGYIDYISVYLCRPQY